MSSNYYDFVHYTDVPIRNRMRFGACGHFAVQLSKITNDYTHNLIGKIFSKSNHYERHTAKYKEDELSLIKNNLINNSLFTSIGLKVATNDINIITINIWDLYVPDAPRFNYDPETLRVYEFFTDAHNLYLYKRSHVETFINYLMRAFDIFEPEYGWCDRYDYLNKFEGKDPRQGMFGLTFYGWEMVEKIGKDRLLSAPVFRVEELEKGIMLQLADHPFSPQPVKVRNAVLKHLEIAPLRKVKLVKKKNIFKKARTPSEPRLELKPVVETRIVVGLSAEDVVIESEGTNLFEYFLQKYYSKIEAQLEHYDLSSDLAECLGTPQFQFCHWFDHQNVGLEAFLSGCDYSSYDSFKPFIGLQAGKSIDESDEYNYSHIQDDQEIHKTYKKVKKALNKLGVGGKPSIFLLRYVVTCEEEG